MYPLNPFVLIDKDAIAFLKAANIDITKQYFPGTQYEINGGVIWGAVDTLVKGLKANNLWNKHKFWHCIIGDTLVSKSINLINPSLYNLTYSGSIQNDINGLSTLDPSGYANTNFNANLLSNNCHLAVYSQTSGRLGRSGQSDFGVFLSSSSAVSIGVYRNDSAASFSDIWEDSSVAIISPNNGGLGLYIGNRQSSNILQHWENGIKLITSTSTTNYYKPNITLKLFKPWVAPSITGRTLSHTSAGDALTDAEVIIKTQLIKQFETTLKRNVI